MFSDISTRTGLKKAYNKFETLSNRLDNAYKKNLGNEKIMGGVLKFMLGCVWTPCYGRKYSNKVFFFLVRHYSRIDIKTLTDILSKLVPLFDIPACRILALYSLDFMSHPGGPEARTQIAAIMPRLLEQMQTYPTGPRTNEHCIVTMAHSFIATLEVPISELPDPSLVETFNIPLMLRLVVEVIKKPWVTSYTLSHTIGPPCPQPDTTRNTVKTFLHYLIYLLDASEALTLCAGRKDLWPFSMYLR